MSTIRTNDAFTVWRELLRGYSLMIGFCWAVTGLIVAIVVVSTTLAGEVTESLWLNTGSTQPRYFLLAMGVMLAATHLPVYVAHGVTRRLFLVAGVGFTVAVSAAFAAITVIGFGLERLLFSWQGTLDRLPEPYPMNTLGDGLRVALALALLGTVYLCCGWLIGSIYYRYGAWFGTLLIPAAAVPLFVAEAGIGEKPLGAWLVQELIGSEMPYGVGLALAVGSAVTMLALIYGSIQALPIRSRK